MTIVINRWSIDTGKRPALGTQTSAELELFRPV